MTIHACDDDVTYYRFDGLGIAIRSDDPALLMTVHQRLAPFASPDDARPLDLRFEFHSVADDVAHPMESAPEQARIIFNLPGGCVRYWDERDRLYFDYGDHVRLVCDVGPGCSRVWARGAEDPWFLSHPMFTVPLLELLKRRGRYSIHAAGIALGDGCLLLAGPSGSGKSTLSLAMLRAGFDFLGDDTLFLIREGDGVRVLPFPDEVDATEHTIELFPELRDVPGRPGWPKRGFRAETVYGTAGSVAGTGLTEAQRPSVVIFPRISSAGTSVLTPLRREEAFLELASNVMLTDPTASQAHLDALAALVRQTDCYRLETARDFDAVASLCRSLLT